MCVSVSVPVPVFVSVVSPPAAVTMNDNNKKDWCSNPGGTTTMSSGLSDCTWKFDATTIDGLAGQDLSK